MANVLNSLVSASNAYADRATRNDLLRDERNQNALLRAEKDRAQQNRLMIGNALAGGDKAAAADIALRTGNLETGQAINAQQVAQERENASQAYRIFMSEKDPARRQALLSQIPGFDDEDMMVLQTNPDAFLARIQDVDDWLKRQQTVADTRQDQAFQMQKQREGQAARAALQDDQQAFSAEQSRLARDNASQGKGRDIATGLRKEFTGQTKEEQSVARAFGRVQASVEDPSAAGDLALIFNYMKMLDPGSTVREGEFATAQNAGGVGDTMIARYNNVLKGERLSATQRTDFYNRAQRLFSSAEGTFGAKRERFSQIAETNGADPSQVVFDLAEGLNMADAEDLDTIKSKYGLQ